MAGAEGLEVAGNPSCGARKMFPLGARTFFDRCANPCSLLPPPAAVAGVARHAPRASDSTFFSDKIDPAVKAAGSILAGAEGLEPSARGFGAAVESSKPHRQATF